MPTLLRELYLSLLFIVGGGAVIAPFVGIQLPEFSYTTASGDPVEMPRTVVVYAVFLLIAIAALAKRLMDRSSKPEESDAQ